MRNVVLAFVLAGCLHGTLALATASPEMAVPSALAAVLLGVLAACAAFGAVGWEAVALGALSPLVFAWLSRQVSPNAAVAALCLAWLAPRFTLARERRHLIAAAVCASASSWLAGVIVASYADEGTMLRLTACVFAGAALSLASDLTPTDTPIASGLAAAATVIGGEVGASLDRAADLHRRLVKQPGKAVDRAPFRALVELADRRAALRDAPGPDGEVARAEVDAAIAAAVSKLVATGERKTAEVAVDAAIAEPVPTTPRPVANAEQDG